jgi:hypothetical protein
MWAPHPGSTTRRRRSGHDLPGKSPADRKLVKNGMHLDLVPDNLTPRSSGALARGASRVDIGQGDASHVVLADPEGNEFCILQPESKS